MPGNKKPRRKLGVKSGTMESTAKALVRGAQQGKAEYLKQKARCDRLNQLPLSHPMSCHMIEKTMAPLERYLEDHERTGTVMVEDGTTEPVLWDGDAYIRIIPGILHMCFVFEKMAEARTWPKMPQGLRVYAIGMQIGRPVDADDFAASRETIAWMRKWMGTLTPLKWRELFDWATSLDELKLAA